MARYKRDFTEEKMKKWEKEKRGQGILEEYTPWLRTQDVSSIGRKRRVRGNLVNRTYHLLSDLEYDVFCIIEFSSNVLDIREQFPLKREDTLRIADDMGIVHPRDSHTQENIVMSTDFVITIEKNEDICTLARAVKPFEQLADFRVLEKLEIERRYWEEKNVDWDIITERQINPILASNIDKVRSAYNIMRTDMFKDMSRTNLKRIENELKSLLVGRVIIRDVCNFIDDKHGLEQGSALSLAKHLIATKCIDCDMQNRRLEFDKEMKILGKNTKGVLEVI